MSDTEKVKLIDKIIADGLEYESVSQPKSYYLGLLYAITSAVDFGNETN